MPKDENKPRRKKLTPYQRIYRAGAINRTSIRLSREECHLLSMDDAIETRAELDDQIDDYGENSAGETDKWAWFQGSDNPPKDRSDDELLEHQEDAGAEGNDNGSDNR